MPIKPETTSGKIPSRRYVAIPLHNSTGNFTKIVQRLPVQIGIAPINLDQLHGIRSWARKEASMIKSKTKLRLINASHQCFSRLGWMGTTTREIAHIAGINEATLFRHFGSKNQLLITMVGYYIDAQTELLQQAIERDVQLEEFLIQFVEIYFQILGKNPDFTRAILSEISRFPIEVRQVIVKMINPLRQQFITFLQSRKQYGEIRSEVNCEIVVDAFTGALFASVIIPSFDMPDKNRKEFIHFLLNLFLKGLKP